MLYESDKEFKEAVDQIIAKHGKLISTTKQLEGNTAGIAILDGNKMALEPGVEDYVMAHEVGHLKGLDHGPELENFEKIASDKQ